MLDALQGLGGSDGFMPHGMCYLWEPDLLWMHVASDTLIWLSYWAIPPFLVYLAWRGRKIVPEDAPYATKALPHAWIFWAFGVFIVACGATHLMAIWTVWDPAYWASGGVKVVTAVASVATAVALPPLVPKALNLLKDARESELRRVELEEVNREIVALYGQLKEYDQLKTEFFANVSHELRTPLSLILGPVDELLDDPELEPERRRKLETVRSNADSLLGHVDDLLDGAQLEAGSMPVESTAVDAAELVRRTVEPFRELAESRGVELVVETPPGLPAMLDARKVERILVNLVSNAFKFTPRDGTVRVELRDRSGDGDEGSDARGQIALQVADSGPGVPPEERKRIFERFRQVGDGSQSPFQGTGLGLNIVSGFAKAMQGFVSVGSAPEGGALFTVILPAGVPEGFVADEEPDAEAPEVGGTAASRVRSGLRAEGAGAEALSPRGPEDAETTILVVEDNREMCEYLADVLGSSHRIHLAHDGESGLEEARRIRPDLIVADIMMPGMSGEEMLEGIRSESALRDTPVLVLTARTEAAMPARLLEKGAQDYVMKPVRVDELKARVRNLLELTRTRRILEEDVEPAGDRLADLAAAVTRSRRELETTVEEKNVLLRELHHRVKGNLQTISSLLRLQLRKVPDPGARTALEDAQGRVAAMALVHERLYGHDKPVSLELDPYLKKLVATANRSHSPDPERVSVTVRSDDLTLNVDQAVPCGLLVYELLTNALRHAFPDGREGGIVVSCVEDDGMAILEVRDDGVGLPEEHSDDEGLSDEHKGLGLDLVQALARQLDGELEMEDDDGAVFRITFPLEAEG